MQRRDDYAADGDLGAYRWGSGDGGVAVRLTRLVAV